MSIVWIHFAEVACGRCFAKIAIFNEAFMFACLLNVCPILSLMKSGKKKWRWTTCHHFPPTLCLLSLLWPHPSLFFTYTDSSLFHPLPTLSSHAQFHCRCLDTSLWQQLEVGLVRVEGGSFSIVVCCMLALSSSSPSRLQLYLVFVFSKLSLPRHAVWINLDTTVLVLWLWFICFILRFRRTFLLFPSPSVTLISKLIVTCNVVFWKIFCIDGCLVYFVILLSSQYGWM